MFEQMLGVTEALAAFHRLNGRHGDLKPQNILVFDGPTGPKLVIGDVGISKFHKEETFFRKGKTTTDAITPSYQAPEVYSAPKEPRSRQYDVWSLGCIFLEFAIWYLHDFQNLETFHDARTALDKSSYFYKIQDNDEVILHPEVSFAISSLLEEPQCSPGFVKLITLTRDDLLHLQVRQRIKAEAIVTELQTIVEKSKKSGFEKKRGSFTKSKPIVFQSGSPGAKNHQPKDSVMNTSTFQGPGS